jgi:hypothetical protein
LAFASKTEHSKDFVPVFIQEHNQYSHRLAHDHPGTLFLLLPRATSILVTRIPLNHLVNPQA